YEAKNIIWSTPMPDYGPGVGSPALAGDKLFIPAECGKLVCVSAKDGKVLWARASSFADAATADERKNNPEVFAEIDQLTTKINESLKPFCDDPNKYYTDVLLHSSPDSRGRDMAQGYGKINALLKKMDPKKYPRQTDSEAGEAAPTPVTDGQNVYALYAS